MGPPNNLLIHDKQIINPIAYWKVSMLFIGHFEANSTDKLFKNDQEKRNYRVRCFHDF